VPAHSGLRAAESLQKHTQQWPIWIIEQGFNYNRRRIIGASQVFAPGA
jgi:hypothetical protein